MDERNSRRKENAMMTQTYARFAGYCALFAGAAGFLYAVAFVLIARSSPALGGLLSALFLLAGGLLGTAALTGLYGRLRKAEPDFALWALLLGIVGAIGAAVHGGYDLANAISAPANITTDLPSAVDPRGLLTFGVAGLALLVVTWLMGRDAQFPRGLRYVAGLCGVLLIALYLGRLIVLDATNPLILGPALLNGFIVNPLWYFWLGMVLQNEKP
jgi:hypothetical protein